MFQMNLFDENVATIQTKVAGTTFEGRQYKLARARRALYAGGRLVWTLVRDPENEHDANAIKVLLGYAEPGERRAGRWAHVGFIPKDIAAELAPVIDATGKRPEVEGTICGSTRRGRSLGCRLTVRVRTA